MPRQQVTIEVDVPEGWELTGEYRAPRCDEHYLQEPHLDVGVCVSGIFRESDRRFILRKAWVPPAWLTDIASRWPNGLWIYKCGDGDSWYLTESEPVISSDGFLCEADGCKLDDGMDGLAAVYNDTWNPPNCDKLQIKRT